MKTYRPKTYVWNRGKNEKLKKERSVSFEDIIDAIEQGFEVDSYEHPNQARYPGQKISVVIMDNYAYLVPYLESDDEIFLKTIIPSRKATKQHTGGDDVHTRP